MRWSWARTRCALTLLVLCGLGLGASTAAVQNTDSMASGAAEAAAAMQAGRFDAAAAIYESLTSARPNDAGLLMNLGMARYMAGHPTDALQPLRDSLRLDASLAPASLFLGASLLDLGRPAEAAPPLQRAVAAMPQNAGAREMLARACLGASQFGRAAIHYRALTDLQPENPKGWYGLTRSYERMSEAALSALQQQMPESPLLELVVADVAVSQGKFASALVIYRHALAGKPPVGGIHEAIAELYERAGKPEWAAEELQTIRRRSPAECVARVAECDFLAGKFRESLAAAMQSPTAAGRYWTIRAANRLATAAVARLESLPPSVELHLIRASLAQSGGRKTDAVTELRAANTLSPGNTVIETALADALVQAHALDEAVPMLERLTHQRGADSALLLLYGEALLEDQQIERAIPILEQAVAAKNVSISAHAALGRAYVQSGSYEQAVKHLNAAAKDDESGDVHYQLARAFQALGRQEDARAALAEYQKRHQRAAEPTPTDAVLTPPRR